jgi:hypothetical protein
MGRITVVATALACRWRLKAGVPAQLTPALAPRIDLAPPRAAPHGPEEPLLSFCKEQVGPQRRRRLT